MAEALSGSALGSNTSLEPTPADPQRLLNPETNTFRPTPRHARVSGLHIDHKQKGLYTRLANEEMKKAYAQVGVADFFRLTMSDPSRKALHDVIKSDTALERIGNLDDLPTTGKEEEMYEPLVSDANSLTECTN